MSELDPRLLEILVCPEDKQPLLWIPGEDALYNPRLRRRYEVRDGIPVMLIDEAVAVDDDAEHDRLVGLEGSEGVVLTGQGPVS